MTSLHLRILGKLISVINNYPQTYTVNEYEPKDKKKRKKKGDSLDGKFEVDLKGPSLVLGKLGSTLYLVSK